jgi:hypothetical protein
MNGGRVLLAMLKADFLERTRRSSFLVTLCLILYLGYAVNTGQILIKLQTYRGIYNSAWVGSLMALVITFFLGVAGFYLVKNAISRDEQTGVGQILATTPLTRTQYLLGKWLSNFAVLGTLVGILALAAIFMQMIYREDAQVQVGVLLAPFLFIALPMMALVAAIAIFFESVPFLKGGFGNLAYFWVFMGLFMAGIFLTDLPWLDVTGVSLVGASMKAAARAAYPGYNGSFVLSMASEAASQTFAWTGVHWTVGLILQRLAWVAVSAGLVLLGGLFFNRFDPTRRSMKRKKEAPADMAVESETLGVNAAKPMRLTALGLASRFRLNLPRLVWLEVLLLVKGLKWYWLAGMAVLWVGCAAAPVGGVRKFWYLAAVIWPVLVWSKMGEREAHWRVEQLIYPSPYPAERLLVSSWLAGVALTALASSGVLLGRGLAGEPAGLLPWCLAVAFIPTLALALGVWSRSSKTFEVIYPILWYLGPFNKENGLAVIDYLGLHAMSPVLVAPLLFTGVVLLLLLAAYAGRRRPVG